MVEGSGQRLCMERRAGWEGYDYRLPICPHTLSTINIHIFRSFTIKERKKILKIKIKKEIRPKKKEIRV